jgi:hypothetical protein
MSMIIDGTNGLTFNNATTQASAGCVLQVVSATYSTAVTSTSNVLIATGLTATITPKFATSKILILINHPLCGKSNANAGNDIGINLYKNGSSLFQIAPDLGFTNSAMTSYFAFSYAYTDSPATTSATTYATYFCSQNSNAATVYMQLSNTTSTITLLEIAA